MAHLLDRLLMRPYVKDEGLARYIDDVMAKPQLVFRVELSSAVIVRRPGAPAPGAPWPALGELLLKWSILGVSESFYQPT